MNRFPCLPGILFLCMFQALFAQDTQNMFQPFTHEWPAGNEVHLASGAPGPQYWQQRADYDIRVTLDEVNKRVAGNETVTYHNQSPHTLTYIWVQLDQNLRSKHSDWRKTQSTSYYAIKDMDTQESPVSFGGLQVESLTDASGKDLPYMIVSTNMRIDLPKPLQPGEDFIFKAGWSYALNNAGVEGRSGYEFIPEMGDAIYEIAQFYPRMCVYDAEKGWQNKPFIGPAEFALEFGDFHVEINVPADHIVSATGSLQNQDEVLSESQLGRLEAARKDKGNVHFVVTKEEANAVPRKKTKKTKTWVFEAENVRDFAFASSRVFVWDAAFVDIGDKPVQVQSFYPPKAMPLWNTYATHAAIHTLRTYSRMTVDYPYPTCNVVNGAVWGMEYPMVAFCGGRPSTDGTYSSFTKYAMISVVMHEVGHNFFPMIVNSDERRWAWMDEGLNSFCQFVTEQEFEPNYPSRRGAPADITGYMSGDDQNPIMTNPESILQNGRLSYEKTAVGLNMLRETIMGRRVFDKAFKDYATRWAWKHPEPWDFFRTMEDASGVDLDWFWRSWFYSTKSIEIGLLVEEINYPGTPALVDDKFSDQHSLTAKRNGEAHLAFYTDTRPELLDGFSGKGASSLYYAANSDRKSLQSELESVMAMHADATSGDPEVDNYRIRLELTNNGGVPMPVKLQVFYQDGSFDYKELPAFIWAKNNSTFSYEIHSLKRINAVYLDPHNELPDLDRNNNLILIR